MEEDGCSVAGVGGCDSLSLKPPPVPGVCADGVAGWPLWLPVLRVSFSPGGMFAGGRRQAAREEWIVCSEGSPGASQVVLVVVLTKDERRGGAIDRKE
jgi:hypothetical protein